MDAVKSFNSELSALYEVKPPISKAKMTLLTRGAIKAIKFYKHVVQSVEKFILKCKPEYKVPGLYVIDSIVRQSRHQFGAEKDVFAPRFSKNIQLTFVNLFKCPAEDKSKVIRVLNLWQKNQVFPSEVIQPLFDLADPNHPLHREQPNNAQSNGLSIQNSAGNLKGSPAVQKSPAKGSSQVAHSGDAHLSGVNNPATMDPNTLAQLQQLHKLLQKQTGEMNKGENVPVRFDRKLLDFDYDDDEDDDHVNPSPKIAGSNNPAAIEDVGSILSNPEVLRQLQTLQQSMTQNQHADVDLETLKKLQEMKQQEEEFDKHLAQTVPKLPFAAECDFKPATMNPPINMQSYYNMPGIQDMSIPPPGYKQQNISYEVPSQQEEATMDSEIQYVGGNVNSGDMEVINLDHTDSISQSPQDDRYRRRRSRSRERSRDRGRDRDRRSRRSRSRSRSRDRRRRSRSRERDREREREKEKDREKEKERRKRGLPPIKKDNLSVCSTTLWVGHLSKLVHAEELSDTFGEYGDILDIKLIPPRGCAFICMDRRQDASRCLQKLKSHKLQGKAITLAWAPGKGVKGKDFKDYWEVELGVSYIPWSKLKLDTDYEFLEEGGMIDEDTMPAWMKAKQHAPKISAAPGPEIPQVLPMEMVQVGTTTSAPALTTSIDTSQPPPLPTGSLIQPPGLPMPIMSPFQLGNRLIGMNLPPGMMPNVPIGVPPPNLPGPMMAPNPLLGMGSPFTQGPPGLLPPMSMPTPEKVSTPISDNMNSRTESLLGMPFNMMPQPPMSVPLVHDDNMDVEMEDVIDRPNKQQPPLSDQLLASLNQSNDSNLSVAVSRLHAVVNQNQRPQDIEDGRDKRDDRDVWNRDSDVNRDRERNNGRRDGFDRNRDLRDHRDERRDRGTNRWGERNDLDEQERKERNEKSLNDRLREMAHQGAYSTRDNRCGPPSPERIEYSNPDRPMFHPPPFNDLPPEELINPDDRWDRAPPLHDGFDPPRMRRRLDSWEEPSFEPPPPLLNNRGDGPLRHHFNNREDNRPPPPRLALFGRPENGPPHRPLLEPEDLFNEERFRRGECDEFVEEPRGMLDGFEPPHRGPGFLSPFGPPALGPRPGMGPRPPRMGPRMPGPPGPPRPDFWSPRPMRHHGPPPDAFHPRSGRMSGPHKFSPRGGPHMRGPRAPGMRHGFPRFDPPSDSFGPPGSFDADHLNSHPRPNRRSSQHELEGEEEQSSFTRDRRSSRWGNSSPTDDSFNNKEDREEESSSQQEGQFLDENSTTNINTEQMSLLEQSADGNSTPLHDEPRDNIIEKSELTENINAAPEQSENSGNESTIADA